MKALIKDNVGLFKIVEVAELRMVPVNAEKYIEEKWYTGPVMHEDLVRLEIETVTGKVYRQKGAPTAMELAEGFILEAARQTGDETITISGRFNFNLFE